MQAIVFNNLFYGVLTDHSYGITRKEKPCRPNMECHDMLQAIRPDRSHSDRHEKERSGFFVGTRAQAPVQLAAFMRKH